VAWSWFRQSGVISSHPPAGNAHRWAPHHDIVLPKGVKAMDWAITLISSMFGAVILNVLSNLLTEKLKNWLTHRSVMSKHKRLIELQTELSRIRELTADKPRLFLNVALIGMYVIVLLSLGIAGLIGGAIWIMLGNAGVTFQWLFNRIPGIQQQDLAQILFYLGQWAANIGALLVVVGVKLSLDQARDLSKVRDFEKYAKGIERQIDEISKLPLMKE
jgi:hypothetical protein